MPQRVWAAPLEGSLTVTITRTAPTCQLTPLRLSRGGLVWFLLHLAAGAVSAAEDVGGKLWCSGNGYPPSPRGGVISLQYRMLHGRTKLMRLRMRTQFWRATAFVAVGLLGAGS